MPDDTPSLTSRLASRLRASRFVLVFTGAGISTGSGIPDFRGPKGLWNKYQPVYYDEFMSSHEARIRHWQFKLDGWKEFRDARPNPGHLALFELDQMGHIHKIVTQNIDGLHQLAGHDDERVIEVHGTARKVECCSCKRWMDPDPVFDEFEKTGQPPLCECGGFLKTATVSFGQPMPADKMQQAYEAAQSCDLVLSIGSTLEVEPAASVPRVAKECGAHYAILNLGPTAHDRIADLRLEGDASQILESAVEHLKRARPE
ncbi:MAG: Sir2 family NAD-dependent protein deacetylase [Acidobacteriota bacterium]